MSSISSAGAGGAGFFPAETQREIRRLPRCRCRRSGRTAVPVAAGSGTGTGTRRPRLARDRGEQRVLIPRYLMWDPSELELEFECTRGLAISAQLHFLFWSHVSETAWWGWVWLRLRSSGSAGGRELGEPAAVQPRQAAPTVGEQAPRPATVAGGSIKSTAETLKLCTHCYRTVIIDAHARMFSLARG